MSCVSADKWGLYQNFCRQKASNNGPEDAKPVALDLDSRQIDGVDDGFHPEPCQGASGWSDSLTG